MHPETIAILDRIAALRGLRPAHEILAARLPWWVKS